MIVALLALFVASSSARMAYQFANDIESILSARSYQEVFSCEGLPYGYYGRECMTIPTISLFISFIFQLTWTTTARSSISACLSLTMLETSSKPLTSPSLAETKPSSARIPLLACTPKMPSPARNQELFTNSPTLTSVSSLKNDSILNKMLLSSFPLSV